MPGAGGRRCAAGARPPRGQRRTSLRVLRLDRLGRPAPGLRRDPGPTLQPPDPGPPARPAPHRRGAAPGAVRARPSRTDPGRNAPYRYHDASLYRGRYYLYFGVVPVLVAFGPWRLVGLGDLPEPAAAAAFALVGFVFGALLLLRHLLRRHLELPRALDAASGLPDARASRTWRRSSSAAPTSTRWRSPPATPSPRVRPGSSRPAGARGDLSLDVSPWAACSSVWPWAADPTCVFLVPILPLLALSREAPRRRGRAAAATRSRGPGAPGAVRTGPRALQPRPLRLLDRVRHALPARGRGARSRGSIRAR